MAKRAKKTTRKMSPTHLANLRAAHAKRRGKKRGRPKGSRNKNTLLTTDDFAEIAARLPEYVPDTKISSSLRIRLPDDYKILKAKEELTLVERFKSTIDALEIQLKRLSNF